MNIPLLKSFSLLLLGFSLIFTACQDPITGLPSDDDRTNLCRQTIQDEFTIELPCSWTIEDMHPEHDQIGTIHTPVQRIHFKKNGFASLDEIVEDEHQTYYYPVIKGRVVFKEIERGGEILVYAYYESFEVEGLSRRLTFWYVKTDDHAMIMDLILTLAPVS